MSSPAGDRRARRQARREEARRAGAGGGATRSRWLVPGLVAVAIVVAAVLAILLPGAGGPSGGGSSSLSPSASGPAASGPSASGSAAALGAPVITGAALPTFENPNGDPAVGMPAPEVRGSSFDGKPVAVTNDGRPKVVLFLAHWCLHCQREVPLIQAWVDSGAVPDGVDLVSVATLIDPARPNYPPDAWLQREGWTVPVIVDPTNSVATAYGLNAFPYWVFIGPDGTVRARAVGELQIANLETVIRGLTGG